MPLNTYPFLKDDTRLILHKDTVYKVKVKCVHAEVVKNLNFPFTEQVAHHQIEQVLRAVFYADERNIELKPILTEHLLVTPVKVPWKAAKHFGFKKDDTVLKTFPFVFEIDVKVRDEIVENVRKAKTKAAIIQIQSSSADKKDNFSHSRSSKNRAERQQNTEIVEGESSTADPLKPLTPDTGLARDEMGCFYRVTNGSRNQKPQKQLTTSECVERYKEILQKAQFKTGTQKKKADQEVHFLGTREAAVSPSNLECQVGSETQKQPVQTKGSSQNNDNSNQSVGRREITPQRRKQSERFKLNEKMRDDVYVIVNEDVSGRRKEDKMKNLTDISKDDADLEIVQTEKLEIPRLSRKRHFEKGTENKKARSVSSNKSKRIQQSRNTNETENSKSQSDSYSEEERHIGKRLRSADQSEKYTLPFKVTQRNDNSESDKELDDDDNNQNESQGHKRKSVHNKKPIETSPGIIVETEEDLKRERKGNSGLQRKTILNNVSDSPRKIQTRSRRIAELNATKVIKKRHRPLVKVHKIKTKNKSEETNTFLLGSHRSDEGLNAESIISPRISHVRPFKSTKSNEKQDPPGSPLPNTRNLDRPVLDEALNPSTSNHVQRTRGQEHQKGGETDRLHHMSLRNPPERMISNRRSLDRYMIEREELEETMKLQQLAQSTPPKRSGRNSPKTSTASSRKRSGLWNVMETFINPVKKLFKS